MVNCPWLPPGPGGLVTSHLGTARARRARALRAPPGHCTIKKPGTTVTHRSPHFFPPLVTVMAFSLATAQWQCRWLQAGLPADNGSLRPHGPPPAWGGVAETTAPVR